MERRPRARVPIPANDDREILDREMQRQQMLEARENAHQARRAQTERNRRFRQNTKPWHRNPDE